MIENDFKVGDRVDYKIWIDEDEFVWETGVVKSVSPCFVYVHGKDELFERELLPSETYTHNKDRFTQLADPEGSKVKWVRCTDENYWSEDPRVITLVKLKICEEWFVFNEKDCPYGWNVIVQNNGYKVDIII